MGLFILNPSNWLVIFCLSSFYSTMMNGIPNLNSFVNVRTTTGWCIPLLMANEALFPSSQIHNEARTQRESRGFIAQNITFEQTIIRTRGESSSSNRKGVLRDFGWRRSSLEFMLGDAWSNFSIVNAPHKSHSLEIVKAPGTEPEPARERIGTGHVNDKFSVIYSGWALISPPL